MSNQAQTLKGKAVMITGASRGIGAAIAECFAQHGARLVLTSVSRPRDLEGVAARLSMTYRVEALTAVFDVADRKACFEAVERSASRLGSMDVLVNNAGIVTPGFVSNVTEENWDRQFAVNLKGPLNMMQAVIPGMVQKKGGSIINMASVFGEVGRVEVPAYAASKAALINLTKSAAVELAQHNIRVNSVSPGIIDTEMLGANSREYLEQQVSMRTAQKRLGQPQEVAELVAYLAGGASSFVTAANFRVNGGWES